MATFIRSCSLFLNLGISYCVFIYSSKGRKHNLDISAGVYFWRWSFFGTVVKSSYLTFKWVHCYSVSSCYYLGREKKSKSMVWDNKYLFNEACSLHTQFFVSFICSSVSLDLGRPSRCSKTFPWIFFFSPLRAMTFYISCKDCIVYCRDICFLKYSLALCWFMFCNLKVL